jgi:hypothetical protein
MTFVPDSGRYRSRYDGLMSINDVEIGEARATMVALATRMLDGELSYIEGTRAILAKLPEARVGNMDEFMAFIGIDSETDRFPFGAVRELWRQEALEQMQTDLDRAEAWAKSYGEPACRAMIARFEREPNGDI